MSNDVRESGVSRQAQADWDVLKSARSLELRVMTDGVERPLADLSVSDLMLMCMLCSFSAGQDRPDDDPLDEENFDLIVESIGNFFLHHLCVPSNVRRWLDVAPPHVAGECRTILFDRILDTLMQLGFPVERVSDCDETVDVVEATEKRPTLIDPESDVLKRH